MPPVALSHASENSPEGEPPSSAVISSLDRCPAQWLGVQYLGRIKAQLRSSSCGLVRLAGARAHDDQQRLCRLRDVRGNRASGSD